MPSPIRVDTFYKRMCGCYYFKEKNTYLKNATLLFNGILKKLAKSEKSFLEIFANNFNSKSYSGKSLIYPEDKILFKDYCIKCAENLNNFLSYNKINKFLDYYNYKYKICGYIDGILEENNNTIQFSYKSAIDTQKDVDFYSLNNYIYNAVKNTSYNTIIMSVPTDTYFQVYYDKSDYTIKRGYILKILTSKMRRKGLHCLNCINKCKPTFINSITRMEQLK